jgi:hypothetical protein
VLLKNGVVQRLLLAKSILSAARAMASAELNAHIVAKHVLNAHDAADLAFAAIADQQGKLPSKDKMPGMIACLGLIEDALKMTAFGVSANLLRVRRT